MRKLFIFLFIGAASAINVFCQQDNQAILETVSRLISEDRFNEANEILTLHSEKLWQDDATRLTYSMFHGSILYELEQYDKAEPLLKTVCDYCDVYKSEFFALNSDVYYTYYYSLANVYFQLKKNDALDFALKAKKLFVEGNKEYVFQYVGLCFIIARQYDMIRNTDKALDYYHECLNTIDQYWATEHTDIKATSLHYMACLFMNREKYDEAIKYEKEVLLLIEPNKEEHKNLYTEALLMLSMCYQVAGDTNSYKAIQKKIKESNISKNSWQYAVTLATQAITENSNPYKAIPFLEEAISIMEQHLPNEDLTLGYVAFCASLAEYYVYIKDFKKAEDTYLSAFALIKYKFEDAPVYWRITGGLAFLYYHLHDYDRAYSWFRDTKFAYESNNDTRSVNYFKLLVNYAILLNKREEYLKAKMYVDIAYKGITQNSNDGIVANLLPPMLSNISVIYCDLGYYEEAKTASNQALELLKKSPDKIAVTIALNNLGIIYFREKEYDKAEKYFIEANKGYYDPISQTNLISLHYLQNNTVAIEEMSKLCDKERDNTLNIFSFLSETERAIFWAEISNYFAFSNSLLYHFQTPKAASLSYNNTLFTKGLLRKTNTNIRDKILKSGDENLIASLHEMLILRDLISKNPQERDSIAVWKNKADEIDKMLTKKISGDQSTDKKQKIKWTDVQRALSKNEATIEFISFPFISRENPDSVDIDNPKYAALILRHDSKSPVFVSLFEQSQLDSLLADKTEDTQKRIGKLYNGGNPRFYNGRKLSQLVWQPLEQYLSGIETVCYSPSGKLNQIAFAALPVSDSLTLNDMYSLHLLSSTREIVRMKKQQAAFLPVRQAVEYGGISYDVTENADLLAASKPYQSDNTELFTMQSRALLVDSTRSGWNFLQGTEQEVIDIESILKKSKIPNIKYMGVLANEESFKALSGQSPELLHIATHGFFLEDEKQIRETGFMQMMGMDENRPYVNSMLRSGLLFAGANRAWQNKNVIEGIEDGILTAEEISQLNLSNTKLVVLSACETGLGEVQNSEGVFGLQRAFKLAGIKTLVMSLWKVDDTATSEFMTVFYQNLMSGKTKFAAFREAQQTIRTKYKNPYYWAAFVMMD
jgi:CHAT domain-containing protein/tetratricopeptide (TPR) repeat protein